MRFAAGSLCVVLGVLGHAGLAHAQQPAPSENAMATRRLLIADAQRASQANDHARALELANQAGGILLTPSLRYFLATEHQAVGHLAAAYASAERCERDIETEPNVALRRELVTRCHAIAQQLLPRLARLTVRLADAPASARVTVNGAPLDRSLWGLPYAVDPGPVRVEATAEGRLAFTNTLPLAEGASGELAVTLAPDPAAAPNVIAVQPRPVERDVAPVRGPGAAPIALAVTGGVVAVTGAVMLVLGAVQGGQARMYCPDYACDTQALLDQAQPSFNAMTAFNIAGAVLLPVGVAVAVGGIGWYAGAPRSRPAATASVRVSPTPTGLFVQGTF